MSTPSSRTTCESKSRAVHVEAACFAALLAYDPGDDEHEVGPVPCARQRQRSLQVTADVGGLRRGARLEQWRAGFDFDHFCHVADDEVEIHGDVQTGPHDDFAGQSRESHSSAPRRYMPGPSGAMR